MVVKRVLAGTDPLLRLLVIAILLATILPVTGGGRAIAQVIANGAIFLLFLLNGLRLPRADVVRGIGHWQFLVPLAAWSFGCMALAGWGLSLLGRDWLLAEIALGLLFIGVLPSTVQSATAYSSLAGGNIANSVVAAAVLNMAGVAVSAPLFALLAGGDAPSFDLAALGRITILLIVPFAIGQLLQRWAGETARRHRSLTTWADRSTIAIAVYVAFSGAVEQGLWERVDAAGWVALLALVVPFLAFGFGGAWILSGALRLGRPDRIAFLFAGGQKSIALGAPLASVMFPPAVAGMVLLPLLTYHLLQMVLSAPLAQRISRGT